MGTFGKLVAFVLFVSFTVFVTFFGRLPALRHTPIGALHRALWIHIPKAFLSVDQRLTSGRISRSLSRVFDVMMHDRHPTVVIFFLLIMGVGEYLYLPAAWPELESTFTKFTVVVTVAMPYTFLYLACAQDPGYITSETHSYYMSLYPFDYINFHPGRFCRTCNLLKPARSKHCSVCKRCVAKADHHCVFINSCVGYENQHWFLLLLFSTGLLATYGGCLGLSLLGSAMRKRYPTWSLWPSRGVSFTTLLAAWGIALQRDVSLGATTLLAILTSPMIWGLLIYTLYHVYRGITTNESLKWSDWQDDMADGYAFARTLQPQRPRDLHSEPKCIRWPVEPEQVLVATNDGQPPRVTGRELPGEGDWQRVWNIRNAENLYDLGFWDNFLDVFVRDYRFGASSDDLVIERNSRLKRG